MIRNRIRASIALICTFGGAQADVLRLKSGEGMQGMLISANSSEVRFETINGSIKIYRVSEVAGLDFAPLPKPAAPPQATAATRAASAVVPAGTEITVVMTDAIEGKASGAGQRYQATVADPVAVGDRVVIPRGANCTVQIVALDNGKDVDLTLYDINVQGRNYATSTEYATIKAEGTSKTKKTVRRGIGLGAVGAGIGALAGGGQGAAIGAAVAGGVGAISGAASKGKEVKIPAETRLGFKLKTPLPLS